VAIGRFGSGSGRTGRVSLTFSKKSGWVGLGQGRVGSIYMLCFFRSLIDFDWIKSHLISGRVGSGQFDFLKKLDRIGFGSGSDPDGSGRVLPPLTKSNKFILEVKHDNMRGTKYLSPDDYEKNYHSVFS
jgi:hypothetical protein